MVSKKSTSSASKTAKNAKGAKSSNTKTTPHVKSISAQANPSTKRGKNKNTIAYIIGAVAAAALLIIGVVALANNININGKNSLTVKDGDGKKIATQYLGFDDFSFRLKIPTSFKTLSTTEIEKKYGKDNAPQTVYANDDKTVNIAINPTNDHVANDQVKAHLNTVKSVLKLGSEIIKDDFYTQGDHNIAAIQLITNGTDGKYYNNMIFFSQNDKLTTVTFNCKEDVRQKWEPVANFVIDSIDFTK